MSQESSIRIGIIGDYRSENTSHAATDAALHHAARALGVTTSVSWLPTGSLSLNLPARAQGEERAQRDPTSSLRMLDSFDGLICAPGSPYASMAGALAAIRHARENDRVFLGTCGGFQHAVIEFARNVLRIGDAEHEETSPAARTLFIRRLSCSLVGRSDTVKIKSGTRLGSIFGRAESVEQFWCSFGVSPTFIRPLEDGGLKISAADGDGNVRAVELPGHRFFIGTLFIPQLCSTPARPHPVMLAFLQAAANGSCEIGGTDFRRLTTHH